MPFAFPDSDFGRRAAARLASETIAWLTTVRRDGLPQPSPIWFLWEDGSLLLYSQPRTQKLRNLAANPLVSVHLDGNGHGGDIVVLSGEAELGGDEPAADRVPAYAAKYGAGFTRIGMTAAEFARAYSVPIRVRATGLRGH